MSNTIDPLKIGLIGVGNHARQILIPAIFQIPDLIQPVALATAHKETSSAVGGLYRLPCYVGYEELIADPNVEAVIIATNSDHEAQAIAALEAGKPVFCETRGIMTREGAARIKEICRLKKMVYQVGFFLRYAPPYQKIKHLLGGWREREPGLRTFNVTYYPPVRHFYNLLLFLNGDMQKVLSLRTQDDTAGIVLVCFENGDIGSIRSFRLNNWSPPYEQVDITHMSGRIVAEDGRLVRFDSTPPAKKVIPYKLGFEYAESQLFNSTYSIPYGRNTQLYMRGYVPELEDFVRCVRNGGAPLSGADDAEKTMLIAEAVERSNRAGSGWVEVDRI